mmetsp:Transcript_6857/g.13526  ORF Transcript_6857/g.13526 Transcript_6857/m.13526 type:complete len:244 (-) Transcript_6857:393-1124(-)
MRLRDPLSKGMGGREVGKSKGGRVFFRVSSSRLSILAWARARCKNPGPGSEDRREKRMRPSADSDMRSISGARSPTEEGSLDLDCLRPPPPVLEPLDPLFLAPSAIFSFSFSFSFLSNSSKRATSTSFSTNASLSTLSFSTLANLASSSNRSFSPLTDSISLKSRSCSIFIRCDSLCNSCSSKEFCCRGPPKNDEGMANFPTSPPCCPLLPFLESSAMVGGRYLAANSSAVFPSTACPASEVE